MGGEGKIVFGQWKIYVFCVRRFRLLIRNHFQKKKKQTHAHTRFSRFFFVFKLMVKRKKLIKSVELRSKFVIRTPECFVILFFFFFNQSKIWTGLIWSGSTKTVTTRGLLLSIGIFDSTFKQMNPLFNYISAEKIAETKTTFKLLHLCV